MLPSEPLIQNEPPIKATSKSHHGLAHALEAWAQTPAGQYIMRWEQAWVGKAVGDVFGYHAVQLGLLQYNYLAESRIANCWGLSTQSYQNTSCHIVSDYEELPFATQSLDLVVVPHALEMSKNPHQLLREIDRVLIPDGRVIISGLNPISLWGLAQRFKRFLPSPWPVGTSPLSVARLRDWLELLSFEIEIGRFGAYCWPFSDHQSFTRFDFMEKMGDRWWPMCGAVYLLGAVKRVRKVTLITPDWRVARRMAALGSVTRKTSGAVFLH